MPDPDVYVYLDEFEKGDVFVLSAAFVPVDVASQLLADWDTLRKEIKAVLLEEYPRAANHPKLQGNLLPEIHAVDLFQSKGYYRKYEHGVNTEDQYWLQHYSWLEKALQIIRKHDILFAPFTYSETARGKAAGICKAMFESIFERMDRDYDIRKGSYSKRKLEFLTSNSYLFTLPYALVEVENYLRVNKMYGEIVCDDHGMAKGFSVTESIEWLRKRDYYNHLTRPRFANGLDETLLQVCDVLCYILGQFAFSRRNKTTLKEPLKMWLGKYVSLSMVDTDPTRPEFEPRHTTFMISEILFESCVYNELIKTELKRENRQMHEDWSDSF